MDSLAADADAGLEDGCRATTPAGDNLVLDFVRGESAAYAAIVTTAGGRVLEDPELGLHLADLGVQTPFGNTAHLTQPITAATRPAVVAALRSFFGGRDAGPFLLFSAWPTPDLRGDGFQLVGHPPLMLRPPGGSPPDPSALRIVAVEDPVTLADCERTLFDAYPIDEMRDAPPAALLHPAVLDTAWRFFVGYDGDRPVATAGAYVTDAITMVEFVSARAETRGRGFGAAVTAAATFTAPDRPALLIASDLGQRIYERLGYLRLFRETLWIGHR